METEELDEVGWGLEGWGKREVGEGTGGEDERETGRYVT